MTGGAIGLGAAICLELAQKGYPVIIHYRNSLARAENLRQECLQLGVEAEIIQGDFAAEASTAQFIQEYRTRFQTVDHLIHNVGNYLIKPLLKTRIAEWKDLYQTNVFSVLQMIQELPPASSIINIGLAGIQSVPADIYSPAYTASKLTLWMITKSLAKQLNKIRVNMISPGYLENAVDLPADLSSLPQGRAVPFKEVAAAVLFLLENPSITGQNLEVAGGVRL